MDSPTVTSLDDAQSRNWLLTQFHPDGLRCPRCGSERDEAYVFRRTKRSELEVYRCKSCQQTYTLYSGTAFDGRHLRPEQVVLLLHGIGRNESTAQLARDLGMSRTTVHEIRQSIEAGAPVPDLDALTRPDDADSAEDGPEAPALRAGRSPSAEAAPDREPLAAPGERPEDAPLRLFPAGLRAEDEVVIRCARAHADEDNDRRLRALHERPLDWMYLLAQARLHSLLPLVHHHLARVGADLVPDEMRERLRAHARHIGYRNLRWTDELLRLHTLFEARGLPLASFKGPVLAHAAYGNLGLRSFVDLDLLVHRDDMQRAKDLLLAEGYRPAAEMDARKEAAYLDAQNPLAFVDSDRKVQLELHWAMISEGFSYPLDPEQLWARLEPTTLGGTTISGLAAEDLLLYLCTHGAKHLWAQLLWVSDLDALLRAHPDLDWDAVLERAARLRSERMLYLGLYLAVHVSGAPAPPEVRARILQDPDVAELAEQACAAMYYRTHVDNVGWREKQHLWREKLHFRYKVREHPADRNRTAWNQFRRALLPSRKDRAFVSLPRPLTFLYVLIRPIRILRDHWLNRSR